MSDKRKWFLNQRANERAMIDAMREKEDMIEFVAELETKLRNREYEWGEFSSEDNDDENDISFG